MSDNNEAVKAIDADWKYSRLEDLNPTDDTWWDGFGGGGVSGVFVIALICLLSSMAGMNTQSGSPVYVAICTAIVVGLLMNRTKLTQYFFYRLTVDDVDMGFVFYHHDHEICMGLSPEEYWQKRFPDRIVKLEESKAVNKYPLT